MISEQLKCLSLSVPLFVVSLCVRIGSTLKTDHTLVIIQSALVAVIQHIEGQITQQSAVLEISTLFLC